MDEELPHYREPGSRFSVFLVGLLVGAFGVTVAWFLLEGNPLSDANEVVYETITVADVAAEGDQICWSRNPERRDAEQLCAILALDPAVSPPAVGDRVTIGRVQLRSPVGDELRQVVYVSEGGDAAGSESPTDSPTEAASDPLDE